MHPNMLSQLVADRKDELTASAERHWTRRHARRAMRRPDEAMSKREWRALLRMLQLAR
jgi:hypothetical protein